MKHRLMPMLAVALMVPGIAHAQPAPAGRVNDVPDDLRPGIIDKLQKTLIIPQLTLWKFDYMQPYPTGGMSVCGRVNAVNSMRRYLGELPFYAHIVDGQVVDAAIMAYQRVDDPVGARATAYKVACG